MDDASGSDATGQPDAGPSVSGHGRRSRRLVGLAVVAIGVILAVPLSGLVGSGSVGPLDSRIDSVLSAMGATSARVKLSATGADSKLLTIDGVADFRRNVGRLAFPLLDDAEGHRLPRRGSFQVLYVGRSSYGNDPSLIPTGVQRTKHWTQQTLAPGQDSAIDRLLLQPLNDIRRHGYHSRDLGTTSFDSRRVEHYRASLSATAEAQNAPFASIVDLYIDAQNRVVRLVERFTFKKQTTIFRADFSNFGIHVDVVAPPADQVIQMPTGAKTLP
jgi:hypothetical protein